MAEKLTPQQQMAVENTGGALLVAAAAGSGKTKVLVDRLMRQILDPSDPANVDEFLIITYTKAAALELRGKIAAKLSEHIAVQPENTHLQRQLQRLCLAHISTVHAFCGNVLREYAYRMDLPADFRMEDEAGCRQLQQEAMEQALEQSYDEVQTDEAFRAFVDTQGLGRDDRSVPEILLGLYEKARCHVDPWKWLRGFLPEHDDQVTRAEQTVWGRRLLDDFREYLVLQQETVARCIRAVAGNPDFQKVAGVLQGDLAVLQRLAACSTWDDVVACNAPKFDTLTFPKAVKDTWEAGWIKTLRDDYKEELAKRLRPFQNPSSQVLHDMEQSRLSVEGMLALLARFEKRYAQRKRSVGVLDFSDLEHDMLELLMGKSRTSPTQAAAEVGQRFREVMVDEYQDTNAVQDGIFAALTRERNNLFMVGDVKQSIYRFRQADPGIFLAKYDQFVPAEQAKPGEGRKVLLSHNFRSGAAVLAAANDVFSLCMSPQVGGLTYSEAEALREGIPHIPLGEPEVELHVLQSVEDKDEAEAEYAAERIAALLDGTHMVRQGDGLRPITPGDIVILLRSPGSTGIYFRQALERRNIPCRFGGGEDLLKAQEIATFRAILQILENPRQDIPLLAVLASPVFGFTAEELAHFRMGDRQQCLYDAMQAAPTPHSRAFLGWLDRLRTQARSCRVTELAQMILNETAMEDVFGAMADGAQKLENLRLFYRQISSFDRAGRTLRDFLDDLQAMEEDKGLKLEQEMGSTDAVSIMSIHKSKGLEFPVVLLCSLGRRFNTSDTQAKVLTHKELGVGLYVVNEQERLRYPTVARWAIDTATEDDTVSEELRVLYVAMTRARDRLIMTHASKYTWSRLRKMAARLDAGDTRLLARDVTCMGDWVLLAALGRTEAGELFAYADKPAQTRVSDHPWLIRAVEIQVPEKEQTGKEDPRTLPPLDEQTGALLESSLRFSYGHKTATCTPSKQTATGQKGREKDAEAAADTNQAYNRSWRKPTFREARAGGTERGIAVHRLMQYLNYRCCGSREELEKELERMVSHQLLTAEQGKLVDLDGVLAFFQTEPGRKLCAGEVQVLREFKFSLLDEGTHYGDGLEEEQVLLQGVVDCAILEPTGITLIDFKTDRVGEDGVGLLAEHYRPQLQVYARALERIYQLPVQKSLLYFFHIRKLVEL